MNSISMEGDSTSNLPLQQDGVPIIFPDSSIWDLGFEQILSSADYPPKVFGKDYERNEMHKTIDQDLEKKMLHREIERQRRKEMADLYSSLRSVLPSNSIKGMRSASDQIYEATKYIRYMQNKVRQLQIKSVNLKKLRENGKLGFLREKGSSSKSNLPIVVRVQGCSVGVEVLISCDYTVEGRGSLRLSRILQLLLEEGLNVVDCNCSKHSGRLNYMIQSEVQACRPASIDLQMLQGKLDLAINMQTT